MFLPRHKSRSHRRRLLSQNEEPEEEEAMSRVESRLAKLEADAGTGAIEYVGMGRWDWSAEELADAVAEAEARVGPNGTVIAIEYTDNWRGARQEAEADASSE